MREITYGDNSMGRYPNLVRGLLELTDRDNVIIVHRPLVRFTESLEAAMLLSQLLYWTPRATLPEGWIYKTDDDFTSELMITRYSLRQARTILQEMGILEIEIRQVNGRPATHYHINISTLNAKWGAWLDNPQQDLSESEQVLSEFRQVASESEQSDTPKNTKISPKNRAKVNTGISPEITSEITPEITQIGTPPEDVTWKSLKGATESNDPVPVEKRATAKIQSVVPYGKITKDDKLEIARYVLIDQDLVVLESALGDFEAWKVGKDWADAKIAISFWAKKLNVQVPVSIHKEYVPKYVSTDPFVVV